MKNIIKQGIHVPLPRATSPDRRTQVRTGLKGVLCAVAGAFALLAAASGHSATLTYNFNDGTLQGWHNRVWDISANSGSGGWADLTPNVTAMPLSINNGEIQPASGDNNLFGNNGSQVDPVGGNNDNHLNTLWLRSPQFAPDGSGDLTVQMARGMAHGAVPVDESSISYMADGATGWKGVLLRNVSSGAFVLAKPRTSQGDGMETVTFTAAELAPFVGVTCTLELVNSERGGWGWLSMDNVSIPGVLRQAKLEVAAPSVTVGRSTTLAVTIPSDFNASKTVTAYVTNVNPGRVTINGSAAAVVPVTFAAGAAAVQNVAVVGTALGFAPLSVGCTGLESAITGLAVLPASGLIGRWLTGSQDLTDKSNFSPAGTHDGGMGDGFTPIFSIDVPPGTTGAALDLAASGGAVIISNTVITEPGYRPTFDDVTAKQLSVAFWARGLPSEWNPFMTKFGEGSTGWQIRRRGNSPVATFTVRGTRGEDDPFNSPTLIDDGGWHHFAATWDGVSGTRKLYVDGKLSSTVPNDFGPMGLAPANYLSLGGRVNAGSASPGNTFSGQLFDVRIYGVALAGSAVQNIFAGNVNAIVAYADTPTIDLGKTGTVSISIPEAANATATVTVFVTNTAPAIVSVSGAAGNVSTLTFPAGSANSQTLTLTGLAAGSAQLACAANGLTAASLSVKVYGQHLIGRWLTGAESFADTSAFSPAGTHDGTEIGTPGGITWNTDTPPSKAGKSANFESAGLLISNSSMLDAGYSPTFDDVISRQFTVSFWAKGIPGTWNGFITKRGEDNIGWQMRRGGGITEAFTIRGTASGNADGVGSVAINDGAWHHFAAVWDGYTGTRKCYVDGNLDPSVNLSGDFGPMVLAGNHHLILGARETSAVGTTPAVEGQYQGLLYGVEMYNYPLSESQVKNLAFIPAIKLTPAQRALEFPLTMTVDVVLPAGANQSQAVTLQVTANTPTIASLVGAIGDVVTLNYPVGGSLTQQVTVAGIRNGAAKLTATGGGFLAGSTTFNVWADPGARLIGRWLPGTADLAETSGFRPAGTHNGVAVGQNASALAFSDEVPPGYTGKSLDLNAGNLAVIITNSSSVELGYVETFDNQMARKFSITFWAKGTPGGEWNPWVSKRGENDWGYQVRRFGSDDPIRPTFTIRGTAGGDDPWINSTVESFGWHHYAATWDGTTGIRKLYVDGNSILTMSGDFGPMGLATSDHLMLGGRDSGGFGNYFSGLLYDVRIYSYALDPLEVGVMVNPPTAFSIALSAAVVPQNQTMRLAVTLPATATATAPVTVYLTNNSPSVVSIAGATGNVFAVTFPVGTSVQAVSLLTVGTGVIDIKAGAAGQGSATLSTVTTVVAPKLIGHWFNGAEDLADKSGYMPAGTHDGQVVGAYPEAIAFSTDVPAGFQGKSLDLSANASGSVGVIVANSSTSDAGYLSTFDDGIGSTFSVSVWAKGVPGTWAGFVNKRGEDGIGWQIRRSGDNTEAFTIRGTASGNADGVGSVNITDGKWHHFAAVWNGVTGTRKCYVDGVLDPSVDLVGDFAPMSMAPNQHVGIGTREQGSPGNFESWFNGKLFDVRIYNYPITAADAAALAGLAPERPVLTLNRTTGNQLRMSWPSSFTGYTIHQAPAASGAWAASGLSVQVEGNENVVYAPTSASAQFYRLQR